MLASETTGRMALPVSKPSTWATTRCRRRAVATRAAAASSPPFNFAPASARDACVHGCCMPGYSDAGEPAPGSIAAAAAAPQLEFLRSRGVTDAVVLLGDDELALYAPPGLAEMYLGAGIAPHLLRARSPGAWPKIAAVFDRTAASGGKVVAHCTGGVSRAGLVLAAWLAHRYGLSNADAAAELAAAAAAAGVKRTAPAPEKLANFMAGQGW